MGRVICSEYSNADQYCSELLDRWTDGRTDSKLKTCNSVLQSQSLLLSSML